MDNKKGWVPKNWCFWIVVLGKILESPLHCQEFKPVNPKGNQSLILFGRTDAEVEVPILWSPDVRSWIIGKKKKKRPDAEKIECKRRREGQRMRWLDNITDLLDVSLSKVQEIIKDRGACSAGVHGMAKSQTWLNDWTTVYTVWSWASKMASKSTEWFIF